MTELLKNYVAGQWVAGNGEGSTLTDPVTGEALVRVSSQGLDLPRVFDFAREQGGAALRALTYAERAARLADIVKLLQAKRDDYYAIATANSGTTHNDSAVDIDGGIFTLSYYAKLGATLGDVHALRDGHVVSLSKDQSFSVQHVLTPTRGVALFINAFNFPSWGLWEKAAPALLSGVPVIVKPATATAWLTQRMVADVVDAGILPQGALSVICGSSAGLLDQVQAFDVVSFTGSAETAAILRAHAAFVQRGARLNVEADSLNSAILCADAAPDTPAFELFIKEVVREMTVKSGQKCTAIRRAFVPEALLEAVLDTLKAKLAKITVGNPRNDSVRMGSLVSREQYESVLAGIAALREEAVLAFDGSAVPPVDVDPAIAACIAPHLFVVNDPDRATLLHDVEIFGPVATVAPYEPASDAGELREAHAIALARRGRGSLVASVYSNDDAHLARVALELADTHGRVHAVSPSVQGSHTGHGNVMPMSLHGGPGRAGGGEELGGLRALEFYHRRAAIQASNTGIDVLTQTAHSLES
ncbi:MAG: 3,4-dehydroadipyl-CoA semialdehyde dehydrogenase [Pseudomonadota bacterium]|uniref:3,4-dehydroadipyl-CoA semialdehyde dehydrogenase n=1 Tax=Paraburkholderia TaxID=1822464 RepID=UPI0004850CD8|nr:MULTISPECIES: 3,4-dehydroadipyl-CoA semialdehyde dehydrogenase [Paraburkholderia]PNE56682.1 3,4-dehydroadipyl-CoA semialdehyde dehydrogenase [Paraburkholderia fungorum]USU14516.1 3,4-dehydroadipyl-CoA semialdehyde dehydrogenase [Paraburkholderia fungorum]USU22464.1 3,4-dehydroadipyl-CoA semialdehyde dehydrogenase [Paraburkholderia fungorum]